MIDELKDYDTVRIHFEDGSSTVIHVHHNDSIGDKIVELCNQNGWETGSVTNYVIEG